jgi:hypothetical protein
MIENMEESAHTFLFTDVKLEFYVVFTLEKVKKNFVFSTPFCQQTNNLLQMETVRKQREISLT